MEMHAHVPTLGKTLGHWLVEGLFIVGFPVCPTSSTACGVFFATRPDLGAIKTSFPIFRRAAWDTALSTGALRLLDYDLAAGLSEIYQMQELFKGNLEKVGVSSTDWFDPAAREAAVRKQYMGQIELQYDESYLLLPLYRKYLPLIASAMGHR